MPRKNTNFIHLLQSREEGVLKRINYQRLRKVYKIFHKFIDNNYNPNNTLMSIYKDLFKKNIITNDDDDNKLYEILKRPIKIKKIIYCNTDINEIEYNLEIFSVKFYEHLENFNSFLLTNNEIDLRGDNFKYENLYIAEDKTILYYIEDNYIHNFNVLNKNVLNFLDELPLIIFSHEKELLNEISDDHIILLNNKIINLSGSDFNITKTGNTYKSNCNVQIIIYHNSDYTFKKINANKPFKLSGVLNNWYYISFTLNGNKIIQLIYITPNKIIEYNNYFKKYKIPLHFSNQLQLKNESLPINVYKIFYYITDTKNHNKGIGIICIFQDFFKDYTHSNLLNNKLDIEIDYIYHNTSKIPISMNTRNKSFERIIDNLKGINLNIENKLLNLYISEDYKDLHIINNSDLYKYNVINKNIYNVIEKIPALYIDNITIKLNSNLLSASQLKKIDNNYICDIDVQIFIFANNFIITKTNKNKNESFLLENEENNWYFNPIIGIDSSNSSNSSSSVNILQLIYIEREMIEKYNEYFFNHNLPTRLENISNYSSNTSSSGGGNKSISRRLLKSY